MLRLALRPSALRAAPHSFVFLFIVPLVPPLKPFVPESDSEPKDDGPYPTDYKTGSLARGMP
jgi:hypothetical protein